jgi:hypothetical protein
MEIGVVGSDLVYVWQLGTENFGIFNLVKQNKSFWQRLISTLS